MKNKNDSSKTVCLDPLTLLAKRTELVFILDRSGSMAGLEADTIGGFNSLLARQKEIAGDVTVTTVLFDDQYELLLDRVQIEHVEPIGPDDYFVRGSTALLDAIGKTINKIGAVQKHGGPSQRASHVMFVITTDGLENASREFSAGKIRQMVEHQQKTYGWEFIFLGANIDAIATAADIGIRASRAANFHADEGGIVLNYHAINEAVTALRSERSLDENWKLSLEEDFKKRSKSSRSKS